MHHKSDKNNNTPTPLSHKAYNAQTKETGYIQQLQIHYTHQNTEKYHIWTRQTKCSQLRTNK